MESEFVDARARARARARGTNGAPENVDLRSLRYLPLDARRQVPRAFTTRAERIAKARLTFDGYRRREKLRLAVTLLNHLSEAGCRLCVSDTRNTHGPGVRLRVQVWDALEEAGLVRVCRGSERANRRSRYQGIAKLLKHFDGWNLQDELRQPEPARNTLRRRPTWDGFVVRHTGKRDPMTRQRLPKPNQRQLLPMPSGDPGLMQHLREREEILERIHKVNRAEKWTVTETDPRTGFIREIGVSVTLRLDFIGRRGSSFTALGRIYTPGARGAQSLPKRIRRTLRISGERCVGLDFSANHVTMLYHLEGVDTAQVDDIYRPEAVFPRFYASRRATERRKALVRQFVKVVTNVCLNAHSRRAAELSAKRRLAWPNKGFTSPQRARLSKIMELEGLDAAGLVARILQVHSRIAHRFFRDTGINLQAIESGIMLEIADTLTKAGIPVLPIHDGVVCRARDEVTVREVMERVYRRSMGGFGPRIKREFPRPKAA